MTGATSWRRWFSIFLMASLTVSHCLRSSLSELTPPLFIFPWLLTTAGLLRNRTHRTKASVFRRVHKTQKWVSRSISSITVRPIIARPVPQCTVSSQEVPGAGVPVSGFVVRCLMFGFANLSSFLVSLFSSVIISSFQFFSFSHLRTRKRTSKIQNKTN